MLLELRRSFVFISSQKAESKSWNYSSGAPLSKLGLKRAPGSTSLNPLKRCIAATWRVLPGAQSSNGRSPFSFRNVLAAVLGRSWSLQVANPPENHSRYCCRWRKNKWRTWKDHPLDKNPPTTARKLLVFMIQTLYQCNRNTLYYVGKGEMNTPACRLALLFPSHKENASWKKNNKIIQDPCEVMKKRALFKRLQGSDHSTKTPQPVLWNPGWSDPALSIWDGSQAPHRRTRDDRSDERLLAGPKDFAFLEVCFW